MVVACWRHRVRTRNLYRVAEWLLQQNNATAHGLSSCRGALSFDKQQWIDEPQAASHNLVSAANQ